MILPTEPIGSVQVSRISLAGLKVLVIDDEPDARELVRGLRAAEGGRTPAIALTAFARSEDRTRAMLPVTKSTSLSPSNPKSSWPPSRAK